MPLNSVPLPIYFCNIVNVFFVKKCFLTVLQSKLSRLGLSSTAARTSTVSNKYFNILHTLMQLLRAGLTQSLNYHLGYMKDLYQGLVLLPLLP